MKSLMLGLIVMIALVACKKNKGDVSLQGKWNIESIVIKEYQNGTLIDTDTEPGDGTTVDFQNNGHVVVTAPGSPIESVPYTIMADSKVDIDGEVYEIRNLTGSSVTLFLRTDYTQGMYEEYFLNLKR